MMDYISQIKSRYKNTRIEKISEEPASVEISFPQKRCSVVVSENKETGRYSAGYPELVRDGRGGWKIEDGFSQNMLIEGVFWILDQVNRHGGVRPDIID